MSVEITSAQQLDGLISSTLNVVIKFYNTETPSAALDGIFEQNAHVSTHPGSMLFVKVNVDTQKALATRFNITSVPTIISIRDGHQSKPLKGKDLSVLTSMFGGDEEEEASGSCLEFHWVGADLPRSYKDVTSEVDPKGLDLLNSNDAPRVLVDVAMPAGLGGKLAKQKDWVTSSNDHQLLFFAPFNSIVKLHTIQITSCPETDVQPDGSIVMTEMRPRIIKVFINHPHNFDFSDADDEEPVQVLEIKEDEWNANSTVSLPLRFVRFQKVTSITLYFEEGDDDQVDVTRVDRVRFIGDAGQKLDMGKLEKFEE